MARPKRVEGQKTAYERMEDAFWEMLAEMPYHEMTAKELRGRAGVSHNTFYYHFENMDDMARKMFDRVALPEIPQMLLAAVGAGMAPSSVVTRIADADLRVERMRLLAASGSPLLTGMLRETVFAAWLKAVGLSESDLTSEDRMDLTFAFGGITALFASGLASDAQTLATFAQREIGQGVFRKMAGLAARSTGA